MTRQRLGVVIRSAPWQGRSGRDQLDVALAAAALGLELELYFFDDGLLQLARARDGSAASLPAGHKAWRSLWDFTEVRAWASGEQLLQLENCGVELVCPVQAATAAEMAESQQGLDHLWVLGYETAPAPVDAPRRLAGLPGPLQRRGTSAAGGPGG